MVGKVYAFYSTVKVMNDNNIEIFNITSFGNFSLFVKNLSSSGFAFYVISRNTYELNGLPPDFILKYGKITNVSKILNKVTIEGDVYFLAMGDDASHRYYIHAVKEGSGVTPANYYHIFTRRFVVIDYNNTLYSTYSISLIKIKQLSINGNDVNPNGDIFENITGADLIEFNGIPVTLLLNKRPNMEIYTSITLIDDKIPISYYNVWFPNGKSLKPIVSLSSFLNNSVKISTSDTGLYYNMQTRTAYIPTGNMIYFNALPKIIPASYRTIGNTIYIVTPAKVSTVTGVFAPENVTIPAETSIVSNNDNTVIIVRLMKKVKEVPIYINTTEGVIFVGIITT